MEGVDVWGSEQRKGKSGQECGVARGCGVSGASWTVEDLLLGRVGSNQLIDTLLREQKLPRNSERVTSVWQRSRHFKLHK